MGRRQSLAGRAWGLRQRRTRQPEHSHHRHQCGDPRKSLHESSSASRVPQQPGRRIPRVADRKRLLAESALGRCASRRCCCAPPRITSRSLSTTSSPPSGQPGWWPSSAAPAPGVHPGRRPTAAPADDVRLAVVQAVAFTAAAATVPELARSLRGQLDRLPAFGEAARRYQTANAAGGTPSTSGSSRPPVR
jgi:hypothetical protein